MNFEMNFYYFQNQKHVYNFFEINCEFEKKLK